MERNTTLPKSKKFKNVDHFKTHLNALLVCLYEDAEIDGGDITFKDDTKKGIVFRIQFSAIYASLSEEFRTSHPKFKKNGFQSLHELVNTGIKWTGSSGACYMYPWDRDMFPDTKLGMEQKAAFFIIVMQVALKFMTSNI